MQFIIKYPKIKILYNEWLLVFLGIYKENIVLNANLFGNCSEGVYANNRHRLSVCMVRSVDVCLNLPAVLI